MVTKQNVAAAKLYQHAMGKTLEGGKPIIPGMSRMQAQFKIAESVASGDFPVQIAPLVRRQLREVFATIPTEAENFTFQNTVLRIDTDEQFNIFTFDDQTNIGDGSNSYLGDTFVPGGLPSIGRRQRYPQIGLSASGKTVRAGKVGEGFGIDWETIINSRGAEVNLVDKAINAFGRHAKQEEDIRVAKQLVNASGFAPTLTALAQHVAGNPDLANVTTIRDAVSAALNTRVGANGTFAGQFPNYTRFVLLVSRQYAPYAKQVLDARTITYLPARTGTGSDAVGAQVTQQIDLGAEVTVVGWQWLSRIFPGYGHAWILLPVAEGDDLPVLAQNRLQGYEQPQFFVRESLQRSVGGAEVDPLAEGDFDEDSVVTKVRHVIGATTLWGEAIQYSLGTNA